MAQASQGSSTWDWSIAPYIWAPSISTDVRTTTPPSSSSSDTRFDDLIDKIDGAFLVHAEGQGDDVGVFADFVYLGLASGRERPRFRTESDLDARLLELAVVWSPGAERSRGIELFGGLRQVDVDFSAQLTPANPVFPTASIEVGETFNDVMLGARYIWAISDRWAISLRGDGSWGDTDGTWNLGTVVQYRTRNGAWLMGYRHLDIDLESKGNRMSLELSGPQFGYAFHF